MLHWYMLVQTVTRRYKAVPNNAQRYKTVPNSPRVYSHSVEYISREPCYGRVYGQKQELLMHDKTLLLMLEGSPR